mmetsp:Transcript_17712/g.33384  ORF Transcript_17712/g.33384 Transcript_17712/m.33384 type:complete len:522 (+) Transcript_17712:79-1644(+)
MGFLDFFRKKRELPANHAPPNFKILAKKTHFSASEIEVLHVRFLGLCNFDTGMIEKIPFVQQPELALNPIIDLAYDMECHHFMNLRLMIKKGNDEKKQLEMEELAMKSAEMMNQREDEETQRKERQRKRHRKRKKKKMRQGDSGGIGSQEEGSLQSLDGLESIDESLESIDESLESIDESLESIDGEHVHSVNLSVEGSVQGDCSDHDEQEQPGGDRPTGQMNDDQNEDKPEVNEETNLEVDKNDNQMHKQDEGIEQEIHEDGISNRSSVNGLENVHSDKSEVQTQPEESSSPRIGRTDSNKNDTKSGEEGRDRSDSVSSASSVDEEGDADRVENGTSDVNVKSKSVEPNDSPHDEKHNNITDGGLQDQEVEDKKEKNDADETAPTLAPMTSSFFRAQHRLKQLEEEKRIAGLPPTGIDFTHFVLLLSEFSPKASLSAKTSYFFKIIAINNTGCISKEEYLSYLKRVTYGLVPAFLYDEYIDDMWNNVCDKLVDGENEITRKMFSNFMSTIDINLFMTIPY